MSISLQLSCSEWADSTIAVLEKQILKQSVWFECCYCKQLLDQKSDWLQMILCHIKRFLTVSVRKLCFQAFLSVLKLCFWIFSSMSLHWIIMLERRNLIFSVWLKMLKSLTCYADKYSVNFTENWKETSHLLWLRMKFWERWIMFLCLSRRLFKFNS